MSEAVLLAGDRYHNANDAFAGVGPALEAAGASAIEIVLASAPGKSLRFSSVNR